MEIVKEWNWWSLLLYVIVAIVTAICFRQSVIAKKKESIIKIFKYKLKTKYIYYFIIFWIFVMFSSFRYIGQNVGGTDTNTYIDYFNAAKYIKFDIKETIRLNSYEYLFYNTMFLVKILGGTYRTFLIIVNALMISCIIYYVDKEVDEENKCIWFILAYLPLLKSFNIVRNCISALFGCVALSFLSKNKIRCSIILTMLAYLNHYIAILLFIAIIFYKYFPNEFLENRKKIVILNIICIIVPVICFPLMKIIMANTGYANYVNRIQISLWGYIPYFIVYILMIFTPGFKDYLKRCNHHGYYKIIYFLSLVLPTFIAINAAYRVLLFFDLPMILLLGDLTEYYKKYISNKYVKFYYFGVIIIVLAYYIFRIYRMWYSSGIMPYYNILFM